MFLKIGKRYVAEVQDLASASSLYCRLRDESGEGGSTWPDGRVEDQGKQIAHISYNGRVWTAPHPNGTLIMEAQG